MKNVAIVAALIFSFFLGHRLGSHSSKKSLTKQIKHAEKKLQKKEIIVEKEFSNQNHKNEVDKKIIEEDKKEKEESYVSRLTNILKDDSLIQAALDECEEILGEAYVCHQVEEYYLLSGKYREFKHKLYEKCNERDFKSCKKLMDQMTGKERKQLEDITYISCMKNNNAEACDIFGTLNGWQLPSKRSLSIKKRACELDEDKCLQYAFYLDRAEDKTANVYMKKACLGAQKESYNCSFAANFVLTKGQVHEAAEMLDFGCSNGDKNACGELYHLYLGTKQTAQADKLKTEICKIEDNAYWHFSCH